MIRRWLRRIAFTLLGFTLAAGLYVGAACALMLWPANAGAPAQPPAVQAWVLSNGIHTDLVFPIRSATIDWPHLFPFAHFKAVPPDAEVIAIGWGDREFYLHTPTWADLTLPRALRALTGQHPAALHVSWLQRAQLARAPVVLDLRQP